MSTRHLYCMFLSALLSIGIAWSAKADDLEIYLGTGNQAVTYNPNVLFIMDTSGSMSNKDDTNQTRLLRVQNALNDVLASATNINAGLMRFSDSGGPVLFPVKDIDEYVKPELVMPITEGADDAVEIGGTLNVNNTILPISQGTSIVQTGLRYQDIAIPQGATITRAFLRLTSALVNLDETAIHIYGQLDANAVAFNASHPISTRTRTTEFTAWESDNEFGFTNEVHNSPDISAVIQAIVDQTNWCGGNDLAILLDTQSTSGSSARQTFSFESGTGQVPQLVIEYDDTTATGCVAGELVYQVSKQGNNAEERSNGYQNTGTELTFKDTSNDYVGLRFSNINLPQGAVILDAHLEFTAYQNGTGSQASMLIQGVNQNDPNDFSPYTRYMLRDKPKTVSVQWNSISPWYYKGLYQSPPVTSIVQQIVNRSGWQPNNEMMFVLSNFGTSKRGGYTYQGKPSGAAKLIIKYQANAIPGSSSTVRDILQSKVDSLTHTGYTPIVDTLYEAAQYFGGRQVDYGLQRGTNSAGSSLRKS
ncbi:MAG: VWA domain-containing protein, partial [Glaciecola sp.]|nr:VWA domain-containing protein [Glaciecola sp.]